jgi:hypothetical protein
MNDLLQPFFFVFLALDAVGDGARKIEADCLWCFSKLLDGLQDYFTAEQPWLYRMLYALARVIERVDPKLTAWIAAEEIPSQEFAFRWMNRLLVREFPMPMLLRIWDLHFSYPVRIAAIHVYV